MVGRYQMPTEVEQITNRCMRTQETPQLPNAGEVWDGFVQQSGEWSGRVAPTVSCLDT